MQIKELLYAVLYNTIWLMRIFTMKIQKQNVPGIKQGKTKRALLLQSLQQRLLNGTVKVNSLRFANELNTFIFNPNTKKSRSSKRQA
jgi:hypothetical protein